MSRRESTREARILKAVEAEVLAVTIARLNRRGGARGAGGARTQPRGHAAQASVYAVRYTYSALYGTVTETHCTER